MKQYLSPWPKDFWKEVQSGKKADDLVKKSQKVAALLWTEVRQVVDAVGF